MRVPGKLVLTMPKPDERKPAAGAMLPASVPTPARHTDPINDI